MVKTQKINALLEFDGIIKAIPTQTNLGLAALANRIENPINKGAILEERQKAITYLAQNPELLDEIKALLLQITPEIEKILLENTVDSNQLEKKLYCQSSLLIPKSIAAIINSNTVLLALWQVVPHVGGFLGTIFDPLMHLAGAGHCNHGHGPSHKEKKGGHSHSHGNSDKKEKKHDPSKTSNPLLGLFKKLGLKEKLNIVFQKIPYKDELSHISLLYTCYNGISSLYHYYDDVKDNYKELFKKAHALQIVLIAIEKINQKAMHNKSLEVIKQTPFTKKIDLLLHSIKGARNIGSLAQLQYFLNDPHMKESLKKILYCIAKADLYHSLASALLKNTVTLSSYVNAHKTHLAIKEGVGPKESSHKVPNDYMFTEQPTIVTGPGGSGKSEYLAMIIAHIISAQSLGVILQAGNSACTITPLDYIITHSNITDTRGVESTSQAEAKRLKEYHEYLQSNPTHKGIIAFDELLKHANPHVAEKALIALISFFNQYPELIALYTTHFEKVGHIKNTQQLSTNTAETEAGQQVSTYKIVHGTNNTCTLLTQLSHALGEKFIPS